jgi:hypothetical protein
MMNKNSASKVLEDGIHATWIDTWRDSDAGTDRETCCILGCSNHRLVGGHVITCDGREDNSWHIAPICDSHNKDHNMNSGHDGPGTGWYIDTRTQLCSVRLE